MGQPELIPHLFRTEFRKITAVLCKHFGIGYLETAEDLVSETFLAALETWPYQGVPDHPTAWLYKVAKNKAINHLCRVRVFGKIKASSLLEAGPSSQEPEIDLSDRNITDSQLQMLFAICHPAIPAEAQIGLALRILCGFGITEIADAFLTSKETINKRLFRAREKLRTEKVEIVFPQEQEITGRLETVLTTLYLLFNEGYYSESQDTVLRSELCGEAMRLCNLLLDHPQTNRPEVNALLAMMCFHASRFKARKNDHGHIILYQDQDEDLWDQELIAKGAYLLHRGSQGNEFSTYHLEACIAYWHTLKADTHEKWENILHLHNLLLTKAYSPVAALNRTYALYRVKGAAAAIREAEKLHLLDNHYYYVLLGELYKEIDPEKSREHFHKALSLAKNQTDKQVIRNKIKGS